MARKFISVEGTSKRGTDPISVDQHQLETALRLHQTGNLQSALNAYIRYLKRHPADANVLHAAGGIHYQLGDVASATKYLKEAVKSHPHNPDYWNDLGGLYLVKEKFAEAESSFRESLCLRPDHVQVQNNLGHALFRSGKIDEAIACFREVIARQPGFVDAHYNLGVALQQSGQLELALSAYEAAIRLQPELAVAHYNLGQVNLKLDRNEAAVTNFRNALRHEPGYLDAKLGLGTALKEAWRVGEAIALLREYVRHRPDSVPGLLELGGAVEIAGDLTVAQAVFREALTLAPRSAAAWYSLACAKKFSVEDRGDIDVMEGLLDTMTPTDGGRCSLHFALGKAYDDCRDYDKAFEHYFAANELMRAMRPATEQDRRRPFDDVIRVFSTEFLEQRRELGSDSDLPIFIVGMPRSGTTLTEQIVSSHPDVHGAGELAYFGSVAAGLHALLKTPDPYPMACAVIDRSNAGLITEPYLKLLRWHSATARHVTDKMPGNYFYLGLIALLFPKATIIHCERDPLDTCLSIYFQSFAKGHEYSYDLKATGETYRQYRRLMAHWRRVLPGRIYTSSYEELVSNPEPKARELIAACGLTWDDRCLQFHQSRREIRTASIAQVREPIYSRSRQRWKNYEKFIGALKEMLADEYAPPAG